MLFNSRVHNPLHRCLNFTINRQDQAVARRHQRDIVNFVRVQWDNDIDRRAGQ